MISSLLNLLTKSILLYKACKLDIIDCGIDSEGDPFVKLANGIIFFGSKTPDIQPFYVRFYFLLPRYFKKGLKNDCLQVGMDIVIRYVEQGLMYNGPKKQSRYKVKSGDHVSEMGAFQGFFSLKLAQMVGADGNVVAIEPIPENFRLLKKNIEVNQLKNVYPINIGVWHKKDMLTFSKRRGDGQSLSVNNTYKDAETVSIPVDSLDNIYRGCNCIPEDFMVIQLNGAESNALYGLTIFKPKNLSIAARYDTNGEDAAQIIKKELEKREYQVEIVQQDFVFAKLN